MKTKLHCLFIVLVLLACIHKSAAQLPVITSFSQNGLLVCANLETGTVASVQWASKLSGPWNTNWAGLDAVTVSSNGTISVSVPMFYRVLGVAQTNAAINAPSNMVVIPAGVFTMGDTLDGESDAIPTNIMVSTFYMETNLVTLSQFQMVYNWATTNGYGFDDGKGFDNVGSGKAENHPVQSLTWYDTVKWCNARSQQTGLTPVYYTDAGLTQVYTNGATDAVYPNWSANGYRLPTEAEWEKAARGGLSGYRFPWGGTNNTISESQANYYGQVGFGGYDLGPNSYNSIYNDGVVPYTSPVGSFAPNGYGLYDMAGNVWEWCWDWYGSPYGQPTTNNPTGPATGSTRIIRGGDWNDRADTLICSSHNGVGPNSANDVIGFRCVRGH